MEDKVSPTWVFEQALTRGGVVPTLVQRLWTPCFLLRPDVFLRACYRKARPRPTECVVKTAWGDELEIEPRRFIGSNIYMRGVHELAVCEVLWRLTSEGECAVDVGANIGVMTSLLSKRVGAQGRVLAFEPHPAIFNQLARNVRHWNRPWTQVRNTAVSDQSGIGTIEEADGFGMNEGTAHVVQSGTAGRSYTVRFVSLDEALQPENCQVLKIDVEGHELEVLLGAKQSLRAQKVRELVFESTWNFPGPAHELLLGFGYELFEIKSSFRGPKLTNVRPRSCENGRFADYLATAHAKRAKELIKPMGWQVLRAFGRRMHGRT